MIKIDPGHDLFTPQERAIVCGIVNSRTGELRASKPKIAKMVLTVNPNPRYDWDATHLDYANDEDKAQGIVAYVWRMVAFFLSDNPQHHCMPVMAEFDLPQSYQGADRKQICDTADDLVKRIVDSVPPRQWHGVHSWHRALYG